MIDRIQALRDALSTASARAAANAMVPAREGYEAVKAELEALPERPAAATLMLAEATAGLAWIASREGADADASRSAWDAARAHASAGVGALLESRPIDRSLLCRAYRVRALCSLGAGRLRDGFDDLTASAAWAGNDQAAASETRAVLDDVTSRFAAEGLPLPVRCARCGRASGATPILFQRGTSALCHGCVDELGPMHVGRPIRQGLCALCERSEGPRVLTSSLAACDACLEGVHAVAVGPTSLASTSPGVFAAAVDEVRGAARALPPWPPGASGPRPSHVGDVAGVLLMRLAAASVTSAALVGRVLRIHAIAMATPYPEIARATFERARDVLGPIADGDVDAAFDLALVQSNLARVTGPVEAVALERAALATLARRADEDATWAEAHLTTLFNHALSFTTLGDAEGTLRTQRETLEAARRARERHGAAFALDDTIDGVERRLLQALEETKRWDEAASVAAAVILRLEDQGRDAEDVRLRWRGALQQAAAARGQRAAFCSVCDRASSDVSFVVEGALRALCDACLEEVWARPVEPLEPATSCAFCASSVAAARTLEADVHVCETCVSRSRGVAATLRAAPAIEGNIGWIDPSVERIHCTFCAKSRREVQKIVAGNGIYICDECIGLCLDVASEWAPIEPGTPKPTNKLACSFCRSFQAHYLVAGPSVQICDECIGLCKDILVEEGLLPA